ncbi:MAG TPA: type II/IV secretion system ATPase subunit [Candidatus Thermoplasmatota archaeon]|nr:type II/IV secretion system ATPase subunit [Candidatus Thermoplasmatota archaeon]
MIIRVSELIHELENANVPFDPAAVVKDPEAHWSRLPAETRLPWMRRAGVDWPEGARLRFRLLKPRNDEATRDGELYLRLMRAETARPALAWQNVVDYARFRPVDPDLVSATFAAVAPARVENPFETGSFVSRRRIVEALDQAWEGERYDVAKDGAFLVPPDVEEGSNLEDEYWIESPFNHAAIVRTSENVYEYRVAEPPLSRYEATLFADLSARMRDVLVLAEPDGETEDPLVEVSRRFLGLVAARRLALARRTAYKLGYYMLRNYVGFGRLEPLMRDPHIEDISCNGPGFPLYVVHSRYQNLRSNVRFDELELDGYTIKLAQRGGKMISVAQPLVDATLPGGSRVQASLGQEVTSHGSTFTIRKFKEDPLTAVDLIRSGTHTSETLAFLWLAVESKCSMVVMGATASGKTTTLNCLSQFIPPAAKVVSIEDTKEITLHHENWLSAVTRESFTGREEGTVSMYDLLRAALRQRPEYILVGEIRGAEGLTLFQAMSTGHTCFSTMHAGGVENAVYRLENAPMGVPRVMVTALNFFLLQGQVDVRGRRVRRLLSLTEVTGIDPATRNLRMSEIFRWHAGSDAFVEGPSSSILNEVRDRRGWTRDRLAQEIVDRKAVLDRLVEKNARHYGDVAKAVRAFYAERPLEKKPRQPRILKLRHTGVSEDKP